MAQADGQWMTVACPGRGIVYAWIPADQAGVARAFEKQRWDEEMRGRELRMLREWGPPADRPLADISRRPSDDAGEDFLKRFRG
jgi:hypothetical protein